MATMKKQALRVLALGMLASATSPALQAGSILTTWNVVVTGDAYVSTETEGPVRVGGNLHTQNGQYGISPRQGTLTGTGGVGLMVGGDVKDAQTDGVKLNNGSSAVIGGSATPANVFANGPATVGVESVRGIGAADAALLQGYSEGFAALAANNTFTISGGNTGLFKVTSTDANGNAVFNVTAAQVFGTTGVGQLNLALNTHTFGAGQSIIINVSGNVSSTSGINFIGGFGDSATRANIIWNFTDATSINLNGGNFSGAMLAYNATLKNTNTMEGSVFVKQIGTSLSPFDGQKAEIHPPLYRGYVPETQAVPEPTGLVMAGIAASAGGAAFSLRRRRAA